MRGVDGFMDEVARELRGRLSLLSDCGERRSIEDGIALLTDYRLSGMDEAGLRRLLASLQSGRSPVALAVLQPQTLARDLSRRWEQYVAPEVAHASLA